MALAVSDWSREVPGGCRRCPPVLTTLCSLPLPAAFPEKPRQPLIPPPPALAEDVQFTSLLLRTLPSQLLLLLGLLLWLLRCGDVRMVTWFVVGNEGGRRRKNDLPLKYELT